MKPIAIICTVLLMIFYFKLYHTFFPTMIYFKNPISCIISELMGCFLAALVTVVLLGQLLSYVLGVVGRILIFLIRIAITLATTGGAAYGAYRVVDKLKKTESQSNKNNWIAAILTSLLVFLFIINVLFGEKQGEVSNSLGEDLPKATSTSSYDDREDDFIISEQTEAEEEYEYILKEETNTKESVGNQIEFKENVATDDITDANDMEIVGDVNDSVDYNEEEYVLPNSDIEDASMMGDLVMTMESKWLRIAKNEIYARHGRRFSDPELQAYFDSKDWYSGYINPEDFDESFLSEIEKRNIQFLDMLYKNATE